jgi:hypothetical protein
VKRGLNGPVAVLAALACLGTARADTHAVVESSRLYLEQETKVTFEYWIAPGQNSRKTPSRATIVREDLGLVWNLDLKGKTYTEIPLKTLEAQATRPKPDMRKLWLDYYDPDYVWTLRDTGETKAFNGFECRGFGATGEADFAEMSATYWICLVPDVPGGRAFHDFYESQYRGDSRMAGLLEILKDHPAGFCVFREEIVEPSIAPTIRTRTRLTRLEEAEAPPGTYDLPEGFKKTGGRGGEG